MRFYTPLLVLFASLTTAQMGPDDTICEFLYGTDYTDACCHTVISRGVNAPCTDIEYVSNLTECSTYHYPTGWAVCIEKWPDFPTWIHMPVNWRSIRVVELMLKQDPAHPASGPLFGHGPSGIVSEYMTLEDLEQVYWDYFSSNAMGETMAAAVAAKKNA
ncbi:hypothetical protein BKA58DRAFT_418671 [Alternaria rosae]|uniref:uncharacterized protein n=1 Tax=Alternaria rosae TaxID=1187941 RepID=UPI001E8D8B8E|nr:uncharacterized protein BKA58DRAFT_418671 [Alternaria rosae]KAH6875043.1 hypothetical protein BKA58DRAFT_418671 [Alternaria rosae]